MKQNKPLHAPLTQFPVIDDELVVAGKPISQWAEKTGETPFYIYERAAVSTRIRGLRAALPQGIRLHYAIKANPFPALVEHVGRLTDGLDVASLGELQLALQTGATGDTISFAGPGKSTEELRTGIEHGVTLNIESAGELARCVTIADQTGVQPRVAIRVNPDFELKASGMKMGGGPRPFGIDAEQVPGLLRKLRDMDVHFRGFHIFSGSQNLFAENLIQAQNASFALARRLLDQTGLPIELLNIGGGFGIPYFPGDLPLDVAPVGGNLADQYELWRKDFGNCEVALELGRYLVGEAGIYVCRVIDRKVSRGQTFLVVDGGMHHHLAASGNFGQLIRKNYPVVKATQVKEGEREILNLVGPLCTPMDILADKLEMGQAKPGDLIAVMQSGAYGYSASPHFFLSHPRVPQLLV